MRCSYQTRRFDWAAFCLHLLAGFIQWSQAPLLNSRSQCFLWIGRVCWDTETLWFGVVEVPLWCRNSRQSHSGNYFMFQFQMFQEFFFDILAHDTYLRFWKVTLKYQKGCFGSKIWVWFLFSKHFANNYNWSRTQIHHILESGKLGVDLDAIDVTRGLVALWHKFFGFAMQRPRPSLGLFHPIRSRGIY